MSIGQVISVASDKKHNFSKIAKQEITLLANYGVKGDVHAGKKVQHLYDKKRTPDFQNLRQVHLIQSELFSELKEKGMEILPAQMGENITTLGIDLLSLSSDTILRIGNVMLKLTGLRKPCLKLNKIHPNLLKSVIEKKTDGTLYYKSGVMAVVITGGVIRKGDNIITIKPAGNYKSLMPL